MMKSHQYLHHPKEPDAEEGQIYILGNHYLMCGDATQCIPKLLNGKKPALLYTDPPYGLGGYAGRSKNLRR